MTLSIVIPVYNTEMYIEDCVNSILKNVSRQDIEVILVDDGSTDKSKEICLKMKEKDKRVQFYTGNNYGVSHARNVGLRKSKGKYVSFADSDDWFSLKAIVTMLQDAEKGYDCVIYGVEKDFFQGKKLSKTVKKGGQKGIYNKQEFASNYACLNRNFNLTSPWAKLYRRELIENGGIVFDEAMWQYEDGKFNLQYFQQCSTICFSEKFIYHWRRVLNEFRPRRIYWHMYEDVSKVGHEMITFARYFDLRGEALTEVNNDLLSRYCDCFKNYHYLKDVCSVQEIKNTMDFMLSDRVLLAYIAQLEKIPRKLWLLIWLVQKKWKNLLYLYITVFFR